MTRRTLPTPTLMFVTAPHPQLEQIVADAVAGGVNVVQWREALPERLRSLRNALHVINTDTVAAVERQADGVHLKEDGVSIESARAIAGEDVLVGRSVHSVEAAQFAEREGADYLIAGNIFETTTHPELEASGIAFLGAICESVSIPVLAIGGISLDRVAECIAAGAAGIAIRSALLHADEASDAVGGAARTPVKDLAQRYSQALAGAFHGAGGKAGG